MPQEERRARLEAILGDAAAPSTSRRRPRDRATAADWFDRFEGAGLDGVVAKPLDAPYQPGKRAMLKIKHQRTADCVVAGFRWHKNGPGTHVGSLLLGLYDDAGHAPPRRRDLDLHLGAARRGRRDELEPLRERALDEHPWQEWAEWASAGEADASGQRLPGATSRWNRGKDLSWEPLRIERVVRGRLRPPPGRSVPPRDDVQALAPGQADGRVSLRPAGDVHAVPAGPDLRELGKPVARRAGAMAPPGSVGDEIRCIRSISGTRLPSTGPSGHAGWPARPPTVDDVVARSIEVSASPCSVHVSRRPDPSCCWSSSGRSWPSSGRPPRPSQRSSGSTSGPPPSSTWSAVTRPRPGRSSTPTSDRPT